MTNTRSTDPEPAVVIERRDGGWRLDRSVPVTLLIGFAVQAIALVVTGTVWSTKLDARMSALEDSRAAFRAAQDKNDARQDSAIKDVGDQVQRQYDKLDAKLDRLIESQRSAK